MRKTVKIVLVVAASLLVLVVLAGFVATRSWFIRGQILPRASAAAGLPITATDVRLSPFSQLEIVGLQVGAEPTPLFKAATVRVRYHLFAILRGNLKVDEVLVDQAQVLVVQDADGKSNLPAPKPSAATPEAAAPKPASSQPVAVRPDIQNVQIRNLAIVFDRKGAAPVHAELRNFTLTLPEFRSGAPVKLSIATDLKASQGTQVSLDTGRFTAEVTAALDGALLPTEVKVDAKLGDLRGMVQAIPLANRELTIRAALNREGNALTVGTCQVDARSAGRVDLGISATGNVQLPAPFGAELDIKVDPVTPEILNLAGGLAGGLQFGRTHGSYIGHLSLRNEAELAAKGSVRFSDITVASPQIPALPPMEFALDHDITANLTGKTARISVLNAQLGDKTSPFFRLQLTQPIALSWEENGKGNAVVPTAKLLCELSNLNLMLAAPFLPPKGPLSLLGGRLDGDLTATIMDMGQRVEFNGNVKGSAIALKLNNQSLPVLDFNQELNGRLNQYRDLTANLAARLRVAGAEAASCQIDAKTDLKTQEGTFSITVPTANEKLLALLPAELGKTASIIDAFDLQTHIKAAAGDHWRRVGLSGDVALPKLQAHLPDGTRLPAVQKSLRFDAVLDLPKNELRLAELQADVKQDNRSVVTLQLTKPLAVSWAQAKAGADDPNTAEVRLTIDRLSLSLANPFLAAARTAFNQGTLSGDLTAAIGKLGNDVAVTGTFNADELDISTPQGAVKSLTIKESIDARLQKRSLLDLRKQDLEIRSGDRTALKVETTGNVDLNTLTGQVELSIPILNERLFALVPSETAKKLPAVERLTLTAKLSSRFQDKGKTAAVSGTIDIPQATVTAAGVRTPADLQAKAEIDIQQTGGSELRIRKLSLLASQAQKPVAHLAVDGTYYLPPAKQESTLTVKSDGADLKWLASLAPKSEPAASAPAPAAPRRRGPIGLTSEPPAVDMKGLWLTTKLDMRNITYGDIAVTNLRGTARVKDNVVDLQPLDLTINDAPFHLETHADLNQPGYQYQAKATLDNLPLTPFIATFAPTLRDQVQGNVKSFALKAKGAGLTPANLSRSFDGGIDLIADGVKLQNLPALLEIATKTGVPELQNLVFDTATFHLKSQDGKLQLSEGSLTGKELRIDTTGSLDYDVRLNLTTRIGVGGTVETRLRSKYGPLLQAKQGDYSYLRSPIPLQGYPSELQPMQILFSMLQQVATQAVTDVVGAVLKSQAEGKKLDGKALLGNFLNPGASAGTGTGASAPGTTGAATGTNATGTAPAAASQAAPAKASRNDLLLNLLQNAVGQPAAGTTTPATTASGSTAPQTAAPTTQTVAPAAPAQPQPEQPKTQKQKRDDALRDIGTGLLNNFLQGK